MQNAIFCPLQSANQKGIKGDSQFFASFTVKM